MDRGRNLLKSTCSFYGAEVMEFYDVINTRRSIRRYSKKAIADDVLERVLGAARVAPSGGNTQPWRFVIVKDEHKQERENSPCML